MRAAARTIAAFWLLCLPVGIRAATLEIGSDERLRGLSWSEGRAVARGAVQLDPAASIRIDAAATTLRGSSRFGKSDGVIDLGAAWHAPQGPFRFDVGLIGHVFFGGLGRLNYAEAQSGVGATVGPADFDLSAAYAPRQAAIGGSNLYLAASSRVAIVGTPLTLVGGIGRSSGAVRDDVRASRLRPDGAYLDWRIGIEHNMAAITASLVYVGTDVRHAAPRASHAGDTILARLAIAL